MKNLLCKFHINLKLLLVNTCISTTELEPSRKAHDKFYTCRIPEAFLDPTLWHNSTAPNQMLASEYHTAAAAAVNRRSAHLHMYSQVPKH